MSSLVSGSELYLLMPLLVLFVTSLVPITVKVLSNNKEQPPIATLLQALIGLVVAGVVVWRQFDNVRGFAFSNLLVFDGLATVLNMLALSIAIFVLFVAYRGLSTGLSQLSEYVFLVLNSVIGMLILGWANDLMVVFIGMELMSLALYVLIGMSPEQKLSKEAAFKYFILGSFASALFLYGVALIFGTVGSSSLTKLAEVGPGLMGTSKVFVLGVVMLVVGLLFKVSVFPFHAWTADVYQGSPTPITLLMATGVKVAMFGILIRLAVVPAVVGSAELVKILQWFAIITMLLGNFAALRQTSLKRMLAYSSIAHSGYVMAGLIAVAVSGNGPASASGVLFYLVSYVLMSLGGFALISFYENDENRMVQVEDLRGMAKRSPIRAISLMVVLLSLAGVPPTLGFMGKLYLFTGAIREGLVWLAAWGIGTSIVGVYYYLRPVVLMFMSDAPAPAERPTWGLRLTLGVSALCVVVVGVFASPLYTSLAATLKSLVATR